MKKVIFSALLVVLCISLFAQITPYGSARVGYWFENADEDKSGVKDENGEPISYMTSRYFLQTNSRFGVNFRQDEFAARVELDGNNGSQAIGLRLLWARQSFGSWSLLVGQEEVVANQKTTQVWDSDLNMNGYGAVDGGRRMQVRMDMDNGFYAALIQPNMVAPSGSPAEPEFLFPMINLGYNWKNDKIAVAPTLVFQQFGYNKDKHGDDPSVMSYLFSVTADFSATDELLVRASFNYGSNTGNMGYRGPYNTAGWKAKTNPNDDTETDDIATLGGWLTARYALNPNVNFTGGFGLAMSSNEDWDNDPTRMGFYVQAEMRFQRLRFIPEIGMMDDGVQPMKVADKDIENGSLFYFGTQLRLDF